MKNRLLKWASVSLVWILAAMGLNVFSLYASDSRLFSWRFHFDYSRSRDQNGYLQSFRTRLWEHGGGHIPDDIDAFLIGRLESSCNAREIDAVAAFYCCQAGGRERDTWRGLSDAARRRIAQSVLTHWRSFPSGGDSHAFVWLEELRQNQQLDKANLIVPQGIPNGYADSKEKIAPAAALFEKWNRKYKTVPFTNRPDPLSGTSYSIQGL